MVSADFIDAVQSISGWTAFGVLVVLMVFGFFRDWVVTRGQYSAMTKLLENRAEQAEEAAKTWEDVAREALAQNNALLGLTDISRKFYTELLGKDPSSGDSVMETGGDSIVPTSP